MKDVEKTRRDYKVAKKRREAAESVMKRIQNELDAINSRISITYEDNERTQRILDYTDGELNRLKLLITTVIEEHSRAQRELKDSLNLENFAYMQFEEERRKELSK